MRPIIRRVEPDSKVRRSLKDWFDLVLPVSTLLIGLVGVWTTVQISGLEDYFRSEISRRNVELSRLEERYGRAEARLSTREDRLEQLSLDNERLSHLNDDQRLVLSRVTIDLDALRSETTSAREQLSAANLDRQRVEIALAQQGLALETMHRQEVYGRVTGRAFMIRLNYLAGLERSTPSPRNLGEEFRQALSTVDLGDSRLTPYLREVQGKFDQVCPAFRSLNVTFPSPPADPDFSRPSSRQFLTLGDREALMAVWRLEIDQRYRDWERQNAQYNADLNSKWERATSQFNDCLCSTLSTEAVPRSSVCPPER